MPKARNKPLRKTRPRILILCEGEKTEPFYFKGLKSDPAHKNLTSVIVIGDTKFNTARELIDQAIREQKSAVREGNSYFEIWVVIDKDGYTKHPESFDRARIHNINIAFSSVAFEFWILLHFKYTTKVFPKCDELISYLKKEYLPEYEKKGQIYDMIKDKTCTAIENAKKIRKTSPDLDSSSPPYKINPYTNIDTLVCRLLHLEDLKDVNSNYLKLPRDNWNVTFSDLFDI